jgi:hypothetical protein
VRRHVGCGQIFVNGEPCRCVESSSHGYILAPVDDPKSTFPITFEEVDRVVDGSHLVHSKQH